MRSDQQQKDLGKPSRLWNARFVRIISIEALLQFGGYMTNPIVSGFAIMLGASIAVAGFIAGLSAMTSLVARPVTGWLADRIAKKSFLIIASVMFCISAFGCALSTSLYLVGFFRIVFGIAFAFRSAAVIALVSLSVPQEHVGQAVGWTGVSQSLSFALGPTIGSVVIAWAGYPVSFMAAGVLFILGLILAITLREPVHQTNSCSEDETDQQSDADCKAIEESNVSLGTRMRSWLGRFIYLPNLPVAIMAGLSIIPNGVVVTMLLTVGEMRSIEGISLYYTVYALVVLISRPTAGKLVDRYGMYKVVVPALIIETIAMVFFAYMFSLPFVIAAGVCMGLGQASAYSAFQAESVRGIPVDEIGRASNTFFIGTDIGIGFGPFIAGLALQYFGITYMFLLMGGFVLFALLMLVVFQKRQSSKVHL